MAENPAISIESGIASRASTHKSKTSSQKFDCCSLHSLGQLPKRADESEIGWFTDCNLKDSRKQHWFTERNTGLQYTTGSPWPHLRTAVRSIRPSAVSGRASSSFTSVGGNTSELAPLVLGAYMIMLTSVVARECKCLYVSVVALAPQNYNRYSKVFVKELRAHHHSGHTGSN